MSELVVYLTGERAGRLRLKVNGNMQFRYDEDYDGARISQAMPIQSEAHPHAVCRAVFGGLLLEGDAREAVARNLGVSAGNDYGLLAELGGDCAGAITLIPPTADLPAEPSLRALSAEELEQTIHDLPVRPLGADPERGTRLSLAGAQPKLPVVLDGDGMSLPLNSVAATTHIIKPEPAAFPGLVAVEAFCMEVARGVGLPVASVEKRQTQSGLPYLLVERYDRDLTVEPRLAMSIDGARTIDEVDGEAWSKLAAQAGLGDRFQREVRIELAERTVTAAVDLVETRAHDDGVVDGVLTGLAERCEKLAQEASR